MIPNIQVIEENGKPRFAVIDYKILKKLEELIEDVLDIKEAEKILKGKATTWKNLAEVKKRLLSNPIKGKRKEARLTQKELAKRLGVKQSFIAKIERPNYNPSKQTLLKIAKALNCPVEEIM